MSETITYGSPFERIAVAFLALVSGIILIYLAIEGPLVLHHITYKTADIVNNQLVGQDIVNLCLLSPLLIVGGVALLFRKKIAAYLLVMTPLFLIYYVLSYTIGWEWSSPVYSGNSEHYMFHFLVILISSLVMLLYSLSLFPSRVEAVFPKKGLLVYSLFYCLFLGVFAAMWSKEVLEVMQTGTTRGYDIAPAAFWLVRVFDLGFTIPLGFISLYLLWTRPTTTFPIQLLFYGFFFTMIIAVNAMGLSMLIKKDPTFLWRDMIVFFSLAVIVFAGFVYVLKHYTSPSTTREGYAGKN
jgi:hypothetical protein